MNLSMSYAEFSLLRELVKKEQMRIWNKEWLPRLKKRADAAKTFERIMGEKMVVTDRGCCAMLLDRFEKAEKEVHDVIYAAGKED